MAAPKPPRRIEPDVQRRAHARPLRELADDELCALTELPTGAFKDGLRVPLLTLGILASYEASERDYEGIEIPRMGEQEYTMRQIGKRKTRPIRRDEAKPGMIFQSSHGYRLLITEVQDNAAHRVDDRGVGIVGHLHATPNAPTRTERYPANSIIYIEQTDEGGAGDES